MTCAPLVDRMAGALPSLLADLQAMVECESPSADRAAVAASAAVVARIGAARLGAEPETIVVDGRTHLRWRLGAGAARVLLLGHHDTVWPVGTLAGLPFRVTDQVVRGPGCFDMKAGLAMAFAAVAALADPSGITILVTGDEELGSPTSRSLIEAEAAGCSAVLVLEAAADSGAVKVGRKGVSLYEVRTAGRAAHAGLEPERGVNAMIELAAQVLAVAGLGSADQGTTVTPTLGSAGTTSNTVPAAGRFAVDVRARRAEEQQRVDEALRALAPTLAGASVEVTGGVNRPPLAEAMSAGLFARAAAVAARLGLPPLRGTSVGGASDGNFTAGIGIPTLDGLGAVGGGAHADDEHVLVTELPPRTALLAALLDVLLGNGSGTGHGLVDGPANHPASGSPAATPARPA